MGNGLLKKTRLPGMGCPVCLSRSLIRASEDVSPTLRKIYYACGDVHCGHTWVAHLEFIATLSPSAKGPIRTSLPQLRLKDRPARTTGSALPLPIVPIDPVARPPTRP
ncbi:ogr/Delta-like zinc finger family protein [Asticcacaulis solisilvae]|uniref:ogr/Delta-like zinc finger family protein n=1 Tax=Asticcacaulis solisilvae TaxID=1217274 RepID=UPI003FD8B88E